MNIGDTVELTDAVKIFYKHSINTHLTNETATIEHITCGPTKRVKLDRSLAWNKDTYQQNSLQLFVEIPIFEV